MTELRRQVDTPVIFLSARDAVPDRIKGLELGADELHELRAAVKELGADAQEEIHAESIAHSFLPYYVRLLDEDAHLLATSPNTPDVLRHPLAGTQRGDRSLWFDRSAPDT